jgi:UbiD family decarboxylase
MRDLRNWLDQVREIGEVYDVDGASCDLEIGALTAENSKRYGPALLFDNIPGYAKGYRILTSTVLTKKRIAITCNVPECETNSELVTIFEDLPEKWERDAAKFPPKFVASGPINEFQELGDDVNLLKIPAPQWHEKDGGRYIGTGCLVIMRDPDTQKINVGTYRVMLIDDKTCTLYISPGKHGNLIMRKYHERGLPCPVAVSLGHDPLMLIIGGLPIDGQIGEYDYMGAMMGESIEVVPGVVTGLPVPAGSEMVLEGECLPGELLPEGPFGEWTGYYAGGKEDTQVFRVKGIMHRKDPIMVGCSPASRGDEYEVMYYRAFLRSAMIKKTLKAAGVPGIQSVWTPELGGTRLMVIISLQQKYAGHVKQAAYVASQCRDGAYLGRYVVVVDEDIDPTDMNEVLWAMYTRVDPGTDTEIIRKAWSSRLDPMLSPESDPENNAYYNSRMIIDACKPYASRHTFPERISSSPEVVRRVQEKWKDLFPK